MVIFHHSSIFLYEREREETLTIHHSCRRSTSLTQLSQHDTDFIQLRWAYIWTACEAEIYQRPFSYHILWCREWGARLCSQSKRSANRRSAYWRHGCFYVVKPYLILYTEKQWLALPRSALILFFSWSKYQTKPIPARMKRPAAVGVNTWINGVQFTFERNKSCLTYPYRSPISHILSFWSHSFIIRAGLRAKICLVGLSSCQRVNMRGDR